LIIPPALRDIASPHRDALEAAWGPIRGEPGWRAPDLDYLFLCFTNRCGSNYLAQLLAATGAFNEAGEFFNAPTVFEHAVPRGLRSLAAYFSVLPEIVPHRGRLAAKAGIDQLVMLADAGILDALGGRARYLLLERQDRLGQAISRVIASQNGRWTTAHESDLPDSALVYDRFAIDLELAKITRANAAFLLFFRANAIVPIHIAYEALMREPGESFRTIAGALDIKRLAYRPSRVTIHRQSGDINHEWRNRYLNE
jgi:LPS sulfotransferase NodH